MIAVLFEETRSPREVEQEDRQRVMFLSAWIDSTPCKLWIISFQYNLRVILLCHILSSLCHLTVTGWYLFSPSPSSAWSALRLTLLPDLICDICRTVSKQGIKLYHNINYQCLLFLFHYSRILLSDESQNWQSYTRPSESWICTAETCHKLKH